jgi:hypothetical protein
MTHRTDELSSTALLRTVESTYRRTQDDAVRLFRMAYDFAVVHSEETLDERSLRALPGTERAVRLGGEGTPRVAEFAAAELGARMQLGPVAAQHLVADALDAWHRLPRLAERLDRGDAKVALVRVVARHTRHLSASAAAKVDADMAEVADGRLPWSRFRTRLEGRVVAADPALAAEREREARERVYARKARRSEDGMGLFLVRAPLAWVVRMDASVAYVAEALAALGDTDDLDQRRAKAVLVLMNPMQAVEVLAAHAARRARHLDVPLDDVLDGTAEGDGAADEHCGAAAAPETPTAETVTPPGTDGAEEPPAAGPAGAAHSGLVRPAPLHPTDLPRWLRGLVAGEPGDLPTGPAWDRLLPTIFLSVHVAAEALAAGDGVVRWDDHGPLTLDHLRHVAPFHRATITPVLDPTGQEPVDAYEIPRRHRRAVHLRTPADCLPFATRLARGTDLDHVEPYVHGQDRHGQSRTDNYAPLSRLHHRIKTHGRWTLKQPFEGVYVWRDPHGEVYVVDHTGTRTLRAHATGAVGGTATARQTPAGPGLDDRGMDLWFGGPAIELALAG